MPETSRELAQAVYMSKPSRHPKRVILRLRVNEFDHCPPTEFDHAIRAYLASTGRAADEHQRRMHHSHIEPFQPREMGQRSFHIILDLEQDMLQDPNFERVEHEVHRVRRNRDGTFLVNRISNPAEERNFVQKMRRFTDVFYPWAR
ncbi:hypothetical protein BDV25DRAFT_159178 [Aspergillus avenaceus]|uniref:Uncharacterized protein n=1 Tax=Aspergillus avenaceus TaxID=36643 RepID=A0A5N6TNS5_ASPAV|nr:hypothetical protein BDV25DRAFT_159178 [Aspergillus avenaceus]